MRELNFELVHVESLSQHWLQHTPKKLGQRHVYHCVISPFLLITLFSHLGFEDTNCWVFTCRIFAQSCLKQDSRCLWSSLPDSPFHDGSYIFHMRQIWTTNTNMILDCFKIVGKSNLDSLCTFIWSLSQLFGGVLQPSKSKFVHI